MIQLRIEQRWLELVEMFQLSLGTSRLVQTHPIAIRAYPWRSGITHLGTPFLPASLMLRPGVLGTNNNGLKLSFVAMPSGVQQGSQSEAFLFCIGIDIL